MAFIGNTNTTQAFTPAIDYFSGNGSTTAFTLSRPVASVAQVQVTIDNVAQNPSSAYTVSANTITFTSAPLSGTNNIYVYYTSPITQVIAPGQGTVNTTALGNITNIASGNSSLTLQTGSSPTTAITIDTSQRAAFVAGTAALPAITTDGDTNTGIFFPAADTIAFSEGGAERMRIDSSGNVGIGNTTPSSYNAVAENLVIGTSGSNGLTIVSGTTNDGSIHFADGTSGADADRGQIFYSHAGNYMVFGTDATERMRINSSGKVQIGTTSSTPVTSNTFGVTIGDASNGTALAGVIQASANGNAALFINRGSDDGNLVSFYQAGTQEGTISVSGTTVSYNGGHLSRWAQMLTKPDLLKGTVMSNLDEMNVYIAPTTYWTEEDELQEGVNVGDVKVETHEVENEQLNKVKVSDVEGDANVAGVFVNWTYDEAHQVDEINMAMTGDMIIRIAQGVTVQRGDLLMSAGDGTAKPQSDDIVRSKTIAKVTSNHVTCTYADGSYCVPCVLMAC